MMKVWPMLVLPESMVDVIVPIKSIRVCSISKLVGVTRYLSVFFVVRACLRRRKTLFGVVSDHGEGKLM